MKFKLLKEAALRELMEGDGILNEDIYGRTRWERLVGPGKSPEGLPKEEIKRIEGAWKDEFNKPMKNGETYGKQHSRFRHKDFKQKEQLYAATNAELYNIILKFYDLDDDDWENTEFGISARSILNMRAAHGDSVAKKYCEKLASEKGIYFDSLHKGDEDDDDSDWEFRAQDWGENGAGSEVADYVKAPEEEPLGWDAAEGRYYGP